MITERQRSRRRASFCGEPLYSGMGGSVAPRKIAHLPLGALRELVVAEDAGVGAAVLASVRRRLGELGASMPRRG